MAVQVEFNVSEMGPSNAYKEDLSVSEDDFSGKTPVNGACSYS